MENCRTTKNGVKIYTYKNDRSHGFFISLFVKAGSMYESAEENGITHFFEHIAIRNVNAVRDGALYALLDEHGIDFNASTYSEMVQFFVSGAQKNFSVGASVIADVLSPITLPTSELEAERRRIRAEIRESDDKTSLLSFSNGFVFEGTSLSRPIAGTSGTISGISRKRLEEYRRRVLSPENIFFYVTGSFSEEDIATLTSLIERHELSDAPVRKNIAPVPRNFLDRAPEVHIKNADFTRVRFSFDLDMSRVSVPESDLIYDILLSGFDSRFFIEMSEKKGLFYDLSGVVERYLNIGELAFTYELKAASLYEAIDTTVDILNDYKKAPLPTSRCMKAGYVDNAYMLFDDIRELNFTFSYDNHIMDIGYADIADRKRAYETVSPERLCELFSEIFKLKNLTIAIKGDKKKIDTERILASLYRLG